MSRNKWSLALLTILALSPATTMADLEVLNTRSAVTADSLYIDSYIDFYDGLDMQEAVNLKGWTAGLDITLPLRSNSQLRLLLPFRTEAEARLVSTGESIDIEGWNGVFDFGTIFYEQQLTRFDSDSTQWAYYLGLGNRIKALHTGTPDEYHHQGRNWHLGVRLNHKAVSESSEYRMDIGVRRYEPSDDLNPGALDDDSFWFGTLRTAWIWHGYGNLVPAVELVADVASNYLSASMVPEVSYHRGDKLGISLGAPIGITSDAPDLGAQVRIRFSF